MPLSFCVLGSGSSGNSTLLALGAGEGRRHALIDCGLSPRRTRALLGPLGLDVDRISDILLTHLDVDHYRRTWTRVIRRHGITVHVHERHRGRAVRHGLDGRRLRLFRGPLVLDPDTRIEPVLLAHDALGTVGFVIEHDGRRLGFVTDVGRVTPSLLERFVSLDALAIESNYDRPMQLASGRPAFLRRRIMGGLGHLSNEQSLDAVLDIERRSPLRHVVVLHLSRQCNDPRIVKRLYEQRCPHLLDRLTISSQTRSTPMLHVRDEEDAAPQRRPGEQMVF